MPLVFVHGVSNRNCPEYRENQLTRDAFFGELVIPKLGLDSAKIEVFNPYWGDHGVSFGWGNASLPEAAKKKLEDFGPGVDANDFVTASDVWPQASWPSIDIVEVARERSLEEAIDIVWSLAFSKPASKQEARLLAQSYNHTRLYAASNRKPDWLTSKTTNKNNFVDLLIFNAKKFASNSQTTSLLSDKKETFGSAGLNAHLSELLERITSKPVSLVTRTLLSVFRKKAHLTMAMFLGDIFCYLTKRGEKSCPGPIVTEVLKAFKNSLDQKLIIIGHSLGGVIAYDILTYFEPTIQVDVLVTVGSQVALFEEMAMYKASQPHSGTIVRHDRLLRPANVKRWLNVFDTSDVFGFRAEGVFEGVRDFGYDTGFNPLAAHSGYFQRPSFYEKLGNRLHELMAECP